MSARFRAVILAAVMLAGAFGLQSAGAADDPPRAQYQEMHANCTVTHRLSDDPIVYPGVPGAAHNHTFVGNPATNAFSTPESLVGGGSSCEDKLDTSAYWFPTLTQNGVVRTPDKPTIYYKSGVKDYRTVQPFPPGFKLVIGDAHTTGPENFTGNWKCPGYTGSVFPASCPDGTSLVVRMKAPSCWDGINLDSANHQSHMAWPVRGVCPSSHPVPLPMLEAKVPYPLPGGNTGGLALSSGPAYSFHWDFMNGWDAARQAYLVDYCIHGGRQCNGYGVDTKKP